MPKSFLPTRVPLRSRRPLKWYLALAILLTLALNSLASAQFPFSYRFNEADSAQRNTPTQRKPSSNIRLVQGVTPLAPTRRPPAPAKPSAPYSGPPASVSEDEVKSGDAVLGVPRTAPAADTGPEPAEAVPSEELLPPAKTEPLPKLQRLPSPAPGETTQELLSGDGHSADVVLAPGEILIDSSPNLDPHLNPLLADEHFELGVAKLSPYKSGFFQKLSLSAAYLGNGKDDNLNMTEIETFAMFGLPFPIVEWPLVISPGYNMHLLDAPGTADLPTRLNDAYVDFMWVPTFVHRYTTIISVTPGYYSDYQIGDADAFRITGKGLLLFDAIPDRLQWVGGVVYLGRDSLKILPVGGAIWSPNDYFRFELIFPKPKIAAMINHGTGYQDWIYALADYGGNTYSIERANGDHDKVTLQDFRIITGIERRMNGGAGYRIEGGYIFGRRVDYLRHDGDFEPKDTIMVRAGITF